MSLKLISVSRFVSFPVGNKYISFGHSSLIELPVNKDYEWAIHQSAKSGGATLPVRAQHAGSIALLCNIAAWRNHHYFIRRESLIGQTYMLQRAHVKEKNLFALWKRRFKVCICCALHFYLWSTGRNLITQVFVCRAAARRNNHAFPFNKIKTNCEYEANASPAARCGPPA